MKAMTMFKKVKRGIFVFALLLLFVSITNVFAADDNICKDPSLKAGEEKEYASDILLNRYGIELVQTATNKFKISMNPSSNKDHRCEKTLKVVEVNDVSVNGTITCTTPYEFEADAGSYTKTHSGLPGVKIKIQGSMIEDRENASDKCYYKKATAVLEQTIDQGEKKKASNGCPAYSLKSPGHDVSYVDCSKSRSRLTEFEKAFCDSKNAAIRAGSNITKSDRDFDSDYHYTGTTSGGTFKCDPDLNNMTTNPLHSYKKNETDSYFTNKQYLYAHVTKVVDQGYYNYNYAPGKCVTSSSPIQCTVECEEAVVVEYGPPVASFAGMCLEYKVRVTSRVSCKVSDPPDKPNLTCEYWNPTPVCRSSNGSTWQQGGPSEEYDACVKACDGGKYTKKCSNSCYSSVYGEVSAGAKVTNALYKDAEATLVARRTRRNRPSCTNTVSRAQCKGLVVDGKTYNSTGCYFVSGGIHWYNGTNDGGKAFGGSPGRFYIEETWTPCNPRSEYDVREDGFYRHYLGDGNYCDDSCHWSGSTNHYLNDGLSQYDLLKNVNKYNKAIEACRNMATCSTTTAEFTIKAKYTNLDGRNVTVAFPYNNQKDTISRSGTRVTTTAGQKNTTLLPNFPIDFAGLQGCYRNNDTNSALYRSTWGFPGSWKNMKTNEVSYTENQRDRSWKSFPNNFCVPNDAADVNDRWFFAYYNRLIEKGVIDRRQMALDPSSKYLTTSYLNKNYYAGSNNSRIDYNIIAQTKNFGYFNWKININCFFAIGTETSCGENCPGPGLNYVVRSVDQKDLFPNKDGTTHDSNQSGREPEYNWSEHAVNNKNAGYKSDPSTYMKAIQNYAKRHANSLYNDSNLDYEFYLSPETLKTIRKDNWGSGGANYTGFRDSDFYLDINGVGRYYSRFIRSVGSASDRKVPTKRSSGNDALRCNNMKNYLSSDCCVRWDSQGNCLTS